MSVYEFDQSRYLIVLDRETMYVLSPNGWIKLTEAIE